MKDLALKVETVEHQDIHGQTPLMWAASRGHTKIVNFLLDEC